MRILQHRLRSLKNDLKLETTNRSGSHERGSVYSLFSEWLFTSRSKQKTEENKTNKNCIIQYSPVSSAVRSIVEKHWQITSSDSTLASFHTPLRIVHKRLLNLSNDLVRSFLPSPKLLLLHELHGAVITALHGTPQLFHIPFRLCL